MGLGSAVGAGVAVTMPGRLSGKPSSQVQPASSREAATRQTLHNARLPYPLKTLTLLDLAPWYQSVLPVYAWTPV